MITLFVFALSARAQSPDWRVLRDHAPSAILVDQLKTLAADAPAPSAAERTEIKLRLFVGLDGLDQFPGRTVRRYVARLTPSERLRLAERTPTIMGHLLRGEPRFRAAIERLESAPPGGKITALVSRLRYFGSRIFLKITRRSSLVPHRRAAERFAVAATRLERMLRENAGTAPDPLTPAEDLIEIFENLDELDWPAAGAPAADSLPHQALWAYLLSTLYRTPDLNEFAHLYRAEIPASRRTFVAARVEIIDALLDGVDEPATVRVARVLRTQTSARKVETAAIRSLRSSLLGAAAARLPRGVGEPLRQNLWNEKRAEARANRRLKLAAILRGEERPAWLDGCERALAVFSKRGDGI